MRYRRNNYLFANPIKAFTTIGDRDLYHFHNIFQGINYS